MRNKVLGFTLNLNPMNLDSSDPSQEGVSSLGLTKLNSIDSDTQVRKKP